MSLPGGDTCSITVTGSDMRLPNTNFRPTLTKSFVSTILCPGFALAKNFVMYLFPDSFAQLAAAKIVDVVEVVTLH